MKRSKKMSKNPLAELAAMVGSPTTTTSEPREAAAAAKKTATAVSSFTSKEDKFKALAAVTKALNAQFKTTNSLVRLGEKVGTVMPHMPTDIPSLDYGVFGIGGVPKGRIIEIFGPESAGKTTATLEIVGAEQRRGNLAAFVDAEHALDPNYAQQLGVNVDELMVSQPDSGEQALETVSALVESKAVSIIVVDSVAALVPQAELDGEMGDSHMGLQARLMSQAMRKLRGICAINDVTVIFINQIREKIGVMFGSPETTTGGRALKFYSSVRLDVRRIGSADGKIMSGGVQIGHKMKIKAVKNKVGTPFQETVVDVIWGKGIDRFADTVSYAASVGAIQRSGAWYNFGTDRLGQGMDNTVAALRANPELFTRVKDELDKAITAQREADRQ
jgi:recombination protein RecA